MCSLINREHFGPDFSQTWDWCRDIGNNINFTEQIKKKNNDQVFNKFKKPCFLAQFFGKILFKKIMIPKSSIWLRLTITVLVKMT